MSALLLAWFMTYMSLSAYAHAVVPGFAQFVATVLITVAYNRYARRRTGPQMDLIRAHPGVEPK
jgi:hypothetical protein